MAKIMDDVRFWWQDAPVKSRYGIVGGIVLVLAFLVGGTVWLASTNYQVLFREMDPKDAAMLAKELDRMKVSYKIADDGATLLVSEAAVHKVRLQLMAKELPLNGTVGFELFNNNEFGMTEFAQRINLQRALQGELARTIMAAEEVKFARVHLVLPESNLFRRGQTKPKASVTVVLKPGKQLGQDQVQGIRRLVAASVADLDPVAVVVLNQSGVALSKGGSSEADEVESGRLDAKKQVEKYLVTKVVEVLDRAFGPGRSIVSVDVQLNADNIKTTKEDFVPAGHSSPASGIVQRERRSRHRSGAGGSGRSDQALDSTEQEASELDYKVGRIVEQVVSTPGSIKRISVGVIVQQSADVDQLDRIREVIAMAAGINTARGDAVVVHSVESLVGGGIAGVTVSPKMSLPPDIDTAPGSDKKQLSESATNILQTYSWAVIGLALVLLAGIGLWIRKQRVQQAASGLTDAQRDAVLQDLQRWLNQVPPATAEEGR